MRDDKPTERPRGAARILGWAVNGGGVIAAGATLILMVHIIVDVAMRYLANAPLPGTIEVVSYWGMVLIIFPAVALTQRRREHIDVSLMIELMPDLHRKLSEIAARLVSIVLVLLLAWYGWFYALDQMERGEVAMGTVTVLIWPARFAIPLGMLLLALQLTEDLIASIRSLREEPPHE